MHVVVVALVVGTLNAMQLGLMHGAWIRVLGPALRLTLHGILPCTQRVQQAWKLSHCHTVPHTPRVGNAVNCNSCNALQSNRESHQKSFR
jgi:hypothetical protein